jgi:hypothetical protein
MKRLILYFPFADLIAYLFFSGLFLVLVLQPTFRLFVLR